MQINYELLDILVDEVLNKIENAVDRTVGNNDVTETEYTVLFTTYRKELINELK